MAAGNEGGNTFLLVFPVLIIILLFVGFVYLISYWFEHDLANREKPDLTTSIEVNDPAQDNSDDREGASRVSDFSQAETQERWNLPGFQSIPAFLAAPEPIGSSFDFRWFRFSEMPRDPSFFLDLENYSRDFLASLSRILPGGRFTLFLVDERSRYRPILQRSGNIFLSGSAIESIEPEGDVLHQLRNGKTVLSEDGFRIVFPLESRSGLLGAVELESESSLFNSEVVSRAWIDVQKYAEFLVQGKIYEQANTDPSSTLGSGIRFHEDLVDFFARKRTFRQNPALYLISLPENRIGNLEGAGPVLRNSRPPEYAFYRIAQETLGVIGPALGEKELVYFYKDLVQQLHPFDLFPAGFGGAHASSDVAGPTDWFRRAGLCLEESLSYQGDLFVYTDTMRNMLRIHVRQKV